MRAKSDGSAPLRAFTAFHHATVSCHEVSILRQQVSAQPTPPSEHVDVPRELEALILACLAKDPAQRPASAGALRSALARLPTWDDALAHAWWRAHEARGAARARQFGERTLTITVDVATRMDEERYAGSPA